MPDIVMTSLRHFPNWCAHDVTGSDVGSSCSGGRTIYCIVLLLLGTSASAVVCSHDQSYRE